jgi:hypothetical protein
MHEGYDGAAGSSSGGPAALPKPLAFAAAFEGLSNESLREVATQTARPASTCLGLPPADAVVMEVLALLLMALAGAAVLVTHRATLRSSGRGPVHEPVDPGKEPVAR